MKGYSALRSLDKPFLRIKETLKHILSKGVSSSLDAQKMLIKATLALKTAETFPLVQGLRDRHKSAKNL
jgi:hypothetical protein